MRRTEEQKEHSRLMRSWSLDPVEAAYRAGWMDACGLHLRGNGVGMTDAYVKFCKEVGHPLSGTWAKIAESMIREFPAGEEGR